MKKIVFLTSTRGTNIRAILNHIDKKKLKIKPLAIITDNPNAGALDVARQFLIPTSIIPFKDYRQNPAIFHQKLFAELEQLQPDLIVAAGFLRILKPDLVTRFANRIVNIHPALLPAFPGLNAGKQALDYGVKFTGCTTHFIDTGVDTGPIILQAVVEIKPGMSELELSKQIQKEEHRIFPLTVEYFCANKIKIEGRKTRLL